MKVYAIIFDWSINNQCLEDSQVDIELFDNYKKAFNRFNEIIANEKKSEISWVADAFDDKGEVLDGYEFDESDFVRRTTGTGNVCERSAFLSSGRGKIIVKKRSEGGMTLAVAMRDWKCRF